MLPRGLFRNFLQSGRIWLSPDKEPSEFGVMVGSATVTIRSQGHERDAKEGCGRVIHNLARESKCPPQRRGEGRSDLVQAAVPGQLNAGDVAAVVRGDLRALRKSCAGGIASCTYSLEKRGTE